MPMEYHEFADTVGVPLHGVPHVFWHEPLVTRFVGAVLRQGAVVTVGGVKWQSQVRALSDAIGAVVPEVDQLSVDEIRTAVAERCPGLIPVERAWLEY